MDILKKHLGLTGDVGEPLPLDPTVFQKTIGNCTNCRDEKRLVKCYSCQNAFFQEIRNFMLTAVVFDTWLDQQNGHYGTHYLKDKINLYLVTHRGEFFAINDLEFSYRKALAEVNNANKSTMIITE